MKDLHLQIGAGESIRLQELRKQVRAMLPEGVPEGAGFPVAHATDCGATCVGGCLWSCGGDCYFDCSGACTISEYLGCAGCWDKCTGTCYGALRQGK